MRNIDFSSWHSVLVTMLGVGLFTLVGIAVRLVMMLTIQQRRERMNRQINERLRVLIAAYKTLGGSFTGTLVVDPTHLRDLRQQVAQGESETPLDLTVEKIGNSDRARRIRDAVEASLSDIILLGTEEQVRLAVHAAQELAAGRPVHTHELVVALRDFIRQALDLTPVPSDLVLPRQGPTRPASGAGGRDKGDGGKEGGKGGGGGDMGGMGGGGGMGPTLGGDLHDDPVSGDRP